MKEIIQQYEKVIFEINSVQSKHDNGIIDSELLQITKEYHMKKLKELETQILEYHKRNYTTKSYDGYHTTYLPLPNVPAPRGKFVNITKLENLNKRIIKYYLDKNLVGRVEESNKPIIDKELTFEDVYWMWRIVKDAKSTNANSRRKWTSDYNRYILGTEFSKLPIKSITKSQIELFIIDAIKSGGRGTKRKKKVDEPIPYDSAKHFVSYLRNAFEYAEDEELIIKNPMRKIRLSEMAAHCKKNDLEEEELIHRHVYSDDETLSIIQKCWDRQKETPHYMPAYAVEMCMLSGARTGEMPSRVFSDFELDKRKLTIKTSQKLNQETRELSIDKTKTGKRREFPISDEMLDLLDRIKTIHKELDYDGDFVFYGGIGNSMYGKHKRYGVMSNNAITDYHRRICKEIDEERLSQMSEEEKKTYKSVYVPYKGVTGHRKTVNSVCKQLGATDQMASSMFGHTVEVNNQNYTYDVSEFEEKSNIVQLFSNKLKRKAD